ncbi:pre-mRNA-processing factor 39 isoform X3 [Denticeps clupeoides]|uniref:pre-mRNA-processing factor 39 isoform X3 n=1 Tax=Denticeps clupeoides TaxID=299321 RepID=UPI0010A2AE8F|nr:pre-mRNA-processing factor 39-like isoform X3 [Denticeps clupeoides]
MAAEGPEELSRNGDLRTAAAELQTPGLELDRPDGKAGSPVGMAEYTAPLVGGEEDEDAELPPDFNRLWTSAQENPLDFTSWTELLQYCEQESHVKASRRALSSFLVRYPLCYGYWKKFADLERRAGNTKRAEEVCVEGLKAIPLSIDLWIHYINLLLGTLDMNLPESTQRIRSVFEEAVAAAGLDFQADRLWDLYAEWEKEQGHLSAMTAVYDRVLRIPTQLYQNHYEKLKTHITSHPPQSVLSPEEYKKIRATYRESVAQGEGTNRVSDGEERPPGEDETSETANGTDTEEAVQKMQELLLAAWEKTHAQNEAEVRKRWEFEDAIKRPYFHVKPLDKAQLKAWQSYLDWERMEAHGGNIEGDVTQEQEAEKCDNCVSGHARVLFLFERCLIACSLYEEFWTKYVQYLEPHGLDDTRTVFRRACEIHLPHKHSIHLQWATFEERYGNLQEARRILQALEQALPGLAVVRLRRVGLERRAGKLEVAESLLREAVEQSKAMGQLHAFYSIKLARLLFKLGKNTGRARAVLQEAIELSPDNSRLYLNLLELEVSGDPRINGSAVQQCISRALAAPLSPETKILFSQRGLQFAEDFGSSVQSVLGVYDDHQKLLKELGSRKRGAENGDNDDSEKISKTDDGSGTMAAAPPAGPPVTTTPPPPMMGDMSGSHAGYGAYGSWYQQQQYGSSYGGYHNPWSQYNQYYPPS